MKPKYIVEVRNTETGKASSISGQLLEDFITQIPKEAQGFGGKTPIEGLVYRFKYFEGENK